MAANRGPAVQVHGLKSLTRAMRDLGDDLTDLSNLNRSVAIIVAAAAVHNAPDDSGDLRVSIRARGTRYRAKVTSAKVYAGPVHWGAPAPWPRPHGKGHLTAQPFASEAAADTEPKWMNVYTEGIQDLVDQVARKVPPGSP